MAPAVVPGARRSVDESPAGALVVAPNRRPPDGDGGPEDDPQPPSDDDGSAYRSRGDAVGPGTIRQTQDTIAAAARRGRSGTRGAGGSGLPGLAGSGGPPWPVASFVTGSARGADLNPPHRRHTITGARNGQVKENNTVYLRGHENVAAADVQGIAEGGATWNPETQLYEINGRSYGVEPNGTVYPVSGDGMVKLDRNEYAALKELVRAGGDLSTAPQLSRNPRFVDNPEAVAKAKAIYDGTYQP